MKFFKLIGVGLVVMVAQLAAFGGELAVLRNGFTFRFERKEQSGNTTRLYTRAGYIDIASSEIASFEPDDSSPNPEPPAPAPVIAPAAPAGASETASATSRSAGPVASGAVKIPTGSPTRADLDQFVQEAANRHRLDPDFVNSVIKAESNFQIRAVSRKGAQGLMQLMPGTASQLGVSDPFDPQANLEGGTAYLSQLLDQYDNDLIKALAAYNAGSYRVDQYHGVPPYAETRAYVARIVRDYNAKKRAQMNTQSSPAKTTTAKKPAKKAPASSQPQEAGLPKTKKPA